VRVGSTIEIPCRILSNLDFRGQKNSFKSIMLLSDHMFFLININRIEFFPIVKDRIEINFYKM
jgi:hypothetical protein